MDVLTLVAALTLSAVFAVAGITKLTDHAGTRTAVRAFGGPAAAAPALALLLPVCELVVAAALLVPATRFVGAAGALGLLVLFTAVIAVSLARGRAPECHCFGQLHSAPASWKTLVRNGLLGSIAVGLLVAAGRDAGPSPTGWIGQRTATEIGVGVAVVGAALVLVAIGSGLLALTRAYGRVLLRLEATEQALRDVGIEVASAADTSVPELGLDPGTPAPPFAIPLTTAETITLDELLDPGLPLLLVFTSPDCGPCHALMPAIAQWQRELDDRLTVAVASAGEPEAIRGQEAEHGLSPMLVDTDLALSEAHLTTGTPSAVLIAPGGQIASYVAAGAVEIESLVDRVLSGSSHDTPEGLPIGELAPELALRGLDDEPMPLVDPDGKETLLLFWNPGCGYCREMLPALLRWESDAGDSAPRLLVVSSGAADETAADGLRSDVALDPEFAAGRAFQAGGTPMAVVVDAHGRIASPVVGGAEGVLALASGRTSVEHALEADA